jgi:hypothetical protein
MIFAKFFTYIISILSLYDIAKFDIDWYHKLIIVIAILLINLMAHEEI